MKHWTKAVLLTALVGIGLIPVSQAAEEFDNPFIGRWALTIPGGGAGWLEVRQEKGYLDADILWGGGSVVPVDFVCMAEDGLLIQRTYAVQRKDEQDKVVRTQHRTDNIYAQVDGDNMNLRIWSPHPSTKRVNEADFSGNRIPPVPPRPDLSKIKYGESINLIKEDSLDGWELMGSNSVNGWSVEDGVLVNNPVQKKGEPHIRYGNLRTEQEFEDFNLKIDVNVPKGGNSGIYLRGIYEVQVFDSYGKSLDSHHMGGIYSRITPRVSAEKPAGEWQTFDITLVDRHVTVVLNGKTIIDNQPLYGCTGGAITSNEFVPGPIYLQGDHDAVSYRNIVLTPIVE